MRVPRVSNVERIEFDLQIVTYLIIAVGGETTVSPLLSRQKELNDSNPIAIINSELRSDSICSSVESTSGDGSTPRYDSRTASPHRTAPPPPRPPPPSPCIGSPSLRPPPPTVLPPPPPSCPPPPKPRPNRPPPPAPGWKLSSEQLLPPLCMPSPPQPDAGSQYSSSPVSTPSPPVPPRPVIFKSS
ncbi:hypothetical protein COOONC_05765 [Cooperia oncophora]